MKKYDGAVVVSTVDDPTDGYDASVDYDALAGATISVAASPTPHAEILEVAKAILAEKNITLDIQTYNDYVVPNTVVEDGTVDANYFQHTRTLMISMPRTAPTSFLLPPFTLSPWVSTAASRPRSMR